MNVLYILRNSPLTNVTYRALLPLVEKGDSVVFLHDSVCSFQTAPDDLRGFMEKAEGNGISIYALEADLQARGMGPGCMARECRKLSYSAMVELVFDHEKVVNLD
jgi:sulfur relay protein TusB/DsrH